MCDKELKVSLFLEKKKAKNQIICKIKNNIKKYKNLGAYV